MNSSISSNSWSKETESRLIHDDFGGDRQRWEDVHAALLEIERQGRALNIAAVELEVARGALAKTQAERDRARLDLQEAVRGGPALARERNEAVERLTWVIKGAHGALTDAGTVVVPGVLDGDIGAAIRQVTCERDEARAEVERLRDRDSSSASRAAGHLSDMAMHWKEQYEKAEATHLDLIMQVARKFLGETRHETAKRYILEREARASEAGSDCAALAGEGKP